MDASSLKGTVEVRRRSRGVARQSAGGVRPCPIAPPPPALAVRERPREQQVRVRAHGHAQAGHHGLHQAVRGARGRHGDVRHGISQAEQVRAGGGVGAQGPHGLGLRRGPAGHGAGAGVEPGPQRGGGGRAQVQAVGRRLGGGDGGAVELGCAQDEGQGQHQGRVGAGDGEQAGPAHGHRVRPVQRAQGRGRQAGGLHRLQALSAVPRSLARATPGAPWAAPPLCIDRRWERRFLG